MSQSLPVLLSYIVNIFLSPALRTGKLKRMRSNGLSYPLRSRYKSMTHMTHPTLVIPELVLLLKDNEGLGWGEALDITTRLGVLHKSYSPSWIPENMVTGCHVETPSEVKPRILYYKLWFSTSSGFIFRYFSSGTWEQKLSFLFMFVVTFMYPNLECYQSYKYQHLSKEQGMKVEKEVLAEEWHREGNEGVICLYTFIRFLCIT